MTWLTKEAAEESDREFRESQEATHKIKRVWGVEESTSDLLLKDLSPHGGVLGMGREHNTVTIRVNQKDILNLIGLQNCNCHIVGIEVPKEDPLQIIFKIKGNLPLGIPRDMKYPLRFIRTVVKELLPYKPAKKEVSD
jgi:hypothetical protein